MLDRHGKCPNCDTSWDGGDILEHLTNMDVFTNKTPKEIEEIATNNYGWNPVDRPRFSKLIGHDLEEVSLMQCPNIRCCHVFDKETGQEYASVIDAKLGIPYVKSESPVKDYISAEEFDIHDIPEEFFKKEEDGSKD